MEYLLDTSSIIAHLAGEKEAGKIAHFIKDSALPFIALSEMYYIIWKKKDEAEADRFYGIVKGWNRPILLPNERVILTAGRFKAAFQLGLADSYIAAFAFNKDLTLLTKDRDFEILKNEINLLYL